MAANASSIPLPALGGIRRSDLAFTVALEVLPKIELADISDVALTKPVAEVPDADVDAALLRMASGNRSYSAKGEKAKAEKAPAKAKGAGRKKAEAAPVSE